LAEEEELNTETLNALKTALDDLKIVDVVRKPQGLSNDLKAGADFMNNVEALQDLVSKGFIPARSPDGSGAEELISSDGEVIATMKNGTEYVLRFGNLTNVGTAGNQDAAQPAGGAPEGQTDAAKDKDGGVHRYLFVMARLNEGAVKRPELEELPALPEQAAASASEQAAGENQSASDSETKPATDQPADGTPASSEAAKEDNPAETTEAKAAEQPEGESAADDANADDENKADEAAAGGDEAKPADKKEGDVKNVIAERSRIEQENQRKLKEYEESLQKGRDNVKELNLRFGDWYFVVADDVFKKIRLNRDNVIKKKEKKEETSTEAKTNGETQPASTPGTIPGLPTIPGTSE
jgi:hypothetical protein